MARYATRHHPKDRVIVEYIREDQHTLTTCPHCGATGKKVYTFRCADGVIRGAMSDCVRKQFVPTFEAVALKSALKQLEKYPGWKNVEKQVSDYRNATRISWGVEI